MRVVVGRIGKPHGLKGEVTVEPRTDEVEDRFAPGELLFRSEGADLVVESSRWHSGHLLVKFNGIDDRNQSEALRGSLVEIDRSSEDSPQDSEEFYDTELQGCTVYLSDGTEMGTVKEVIHLPSQDTLVLDVLGSEVMVPFIKEFVPEVDQSRKRIVISPPPGLLPDSIGSID